jgi:hypothetical protein
VLLRHRVTFLHKPPPASLANGAQIHLTMIIIDHQICCEPR